MRVGLGFDVHRLVIDRKLVLGGVEIPFEMGLLGHSDADVLLHAFMDALLGAAGMGDIGVLFPDTDPQYKNANSLELLKQVYQRVNEQNLQLVNMDAVLMAERPKLRPFNPEITAKIAGTLHLQPNQISIKATTTEKLGFIGREEGIAAQVVVLLEQIKV